MPTEYDRGWNDGYAAAEEDERNRPGIHVIQGYRLCDICDKPIKDEPALYEKPRWWEIWKIGKMMHADCFDARDDQ